MVCSRCTEDKPVHAFAAGQRKRIEEGKAGYCTRCVQDNRTDAFYRKPTGKGTPWRDKNNHFFVKSKAKKAA